MEDYKEVKICSVRDNIQAEMIVEALKNNGIPAIKKGLGSSDVMNIYGGNSLFGEDIFIAEQNTEKALQVLADMGIEE